MERLTRQAELPGNVGGGGRDQTNEFSIRIARFVRGAARGGGALETKEGGALELGRPDWPGLRYRIGCKNKQPGSLAGQCQGQLEWRLLRAGGSVRSGRPVLAWAGGSQEGSGVTLW